MIDRENFHKRLRALMEEHELSVPDVVAEIWGRYYANANAESVAKGRDRLSVWLSGDAFPDPETLERLANALGVHVSDLAPKAQPPN
jgi:transcriptional regulator with XRE-family HTH domain